MASLQSDPVDPPKSIRVLYGQTIIQQYHESKGIGEHTPLPTTPTMNVPADNALIAPICIIGAGVAGLYAAMMLDYLDLRYEVLEASERVGGRLFTKSLGNNAYDYFDAGAMRFPDTPYMKRVFDLFQSLKIKTMPYKLSSGYTFLYYNTVPYQRNAAGDGPPRGKDTFKVEPYVGAKAVQEGPDAIMAGVNKPFRDALMKDWKIGMKTLMEADDFSVRSYLRHQGWKQEEINWIETMQASSGTFDRALSEEVLDSMAFDYPKGNPVSWYCIDRGSQTLARYMLSSLKHQYRVRYRKRVTEIEQDVDLRGASMIVTTADGVDNAYSQVISSIPLPSLTAVKLDRCSLSWDIKSALRELAYGPSTKIGIMFRENWWEPMGIVGGQSFTDSPIRTVVYPSYGPATGPKSRVLIASYARSQDALRMGSLFGDDSESQTLLLNIVLNELEKVHEITPGYLRKYYDPNDTKNCAIFPWNWYSDNLTMGAFAFFGPGQFRNIYPNVTQPACDGNTLHFIGEATSSEHAWVNGALNSAWRGVYEALIAQYGPQSDYIEKFKKKFGSSEEWDEQVLLRHIHLATQRSTRAV